MKPIVYLVCIATFLGVVATATSAIAQGGCGDYKIKDAQDNYDRANFNEVFTLLNPCLKDGFDTKQKVLAYKLLSLTYLALDSTQLANDAITQMLLLNPAYEPEADLLLPFRFVNMVNVVKQTQTQVVRVTSVSKKPEDLYKAPATVMVVTDEDIRQRGYTDLEILFNDLPGFDLSRTYGLTYSNIYQRGYRSDNTERTLFMIDGIEENDLWSNIVYWSTQIPISNVKRVEIVYGPASTIYGANAFLGVVNVITKTAKEVLGNKQTAVIADMGYGSYNTRYADVTAAARVGSMAISVTGRGYFSNLENLSKYSEYDFNPDDYNSWNYGKSLNFKGAAAAQKYGITGPYFRAVGDSVLLTPDGLAAAQNLDKLALQQTPNGNPVGYSNELKAYYLKAKITFNDFTIGLQTWNLSEGTLNSANDNSRAGAKNGNIWRPMQNTIFAVYNTEIIKDKLSIINTTQYRVTEVGDQSRSVTLRNYSNQGLTLLARTANSPTASDLASVRLAYNLSQNIAPYWETQYFYQHSNQFRNELRLLATPSDRLDLVGGLEFRSSSIQGDYKTITISKTLSAPIDTSAKDYGRSTLDNTAGGNLFEYFNFGAFFQGTYAINNLLSVTLGGRYDNAKIRKSGGYGSEFNPRLALIFTPGRLAFKAIYAKAFQDASSRDRYAISSTRQLSNPTLKPDRIDNFELAINYAPSNRTQAGITTYYSIFSNIVEETSVPFGTGRTQQKQNTGKANVFGVQATADFQLSKRFQVYANYTFTNATREDTLKRNETQRTTLTVGDIAKHHFNAGINGRFLKNRLTANLRINFVGDRPVGPGTSVPTNTLQPNGEFPAFFLANGTVTYQVNRAVHVQLIGNNLLNTTYFDPGTRSANGTSQSYRLPQKGLNGTLRLMVSL
ncbi:TonB-dependent receptor plug domain-containing protein [Spirosoma aerophilum]